MVTQGTRVLRILNFLTTNHNRKISLSTHIAVAYLIFIIFISATSETRLLSAILQMSVDNFL